LPFHLTISSSAILIFSLSSAPSGLPRALHSFPTRRSSDLWPARADYSEKEKAALAAYHAIIPEDAEPELLVDGTKTEPTLTFSEGPKWMNGKVYFSNMYFDQNWNADPSKSSIVELSPDGSYKNITQGKMQQNGRYP